MKVRSRNGEPPGLREAPQTTHRSGYAKVTIRIKGKNTNIPVHRAVASAFCDGYEEWLVVDHIDNNKLNNSASNLRWVTASENALASFRRGRVGYGPGMHGEAHPNSRLSDEQVLAIRAEYLPPVVTLRMLAIKYGISKQHVSKIINRRIWTNI